jgi:hypothetical protein
VHDEAEVMKADSEFASYSPMSVMFTLVGAPLEVLSSAIGSPATAMASHKRALSGYRTMQVGLHLGYQNLHGRPDVETFMQETRFAVEAEAMGFDFVGPVEHHFTDYAACPDPFQMLAYVAAKTSKIRLITAAVILP